MKWSEGKENNKILSFAWMDVAGRKFKHNAYWRYGKVEILYLDVNKFMSWFD